MKPMFTVSVLAATFFFGVECYCSDDSDDNVGKVPESFSKTLRTVRKTIAKKKKKSPPQETSQAEGQLSENDTNVYRKVRSTIGNVLHFLTKASKIEVNIKFWPSIIREEDGVYATFGGEDAPEKKNFTTEVTTFIEYILNNREVISSLCTPDGIANAILNVFGNKFQIENRASLTEAIVHYITEYENWNQETLNSFLQKLKSNNSKTVIKPKRRKIYYDDYSGNTKKEEANPAAEGVEKMYDNCSKILKVVLRYLAKTNYEGRGAELLRENYYNNNGFDSICDYSTFKAFWLPFYQKQGDKLSKMGYSAQGPEITVNALYPNASEEEKQLIIMQLQAALY